MAVEDEKIKLLEIICRDLDLELSLRINLVSSFLS